MALEIERRFLIKNDNWKELLNFIYIPKIDIGKNILCYPTKGYDQYYLNFKAPRTSPIVIVTSTIVILNSNIKY